MTTRRTLLFAPLVLSAKPPSPLPIRINHHLVTNLYHRGYPKPFLYPILAPDGAVLSRGWPVEPRPQDSHDHTWHRGIWWGHGDINGQDFWREQEGTATIAVDHAYQTHSQMLIIEQTMIANNQERLAHLFTTYEFNQEPDAFRIDAQINIRPMQKLNFGDTEDGGFAFRLREEFREDHGATLLNSRHQKGAKAIWGQAAEWTDYSAKVDNKTYGVAILSSPTNFRHPSGWHARNYGLNSANPFAASGFAEEKGGQRGAYTLSKANHLTLHYRIYIHHGDAEQARIGERYLKYAKDRQ